MKEINFTCPICKNLLKDMGKSLVCENGHSFDKAKQGYTHLLPVNKMHSKIPGDNALMVSSRRDFLTKGYYNIFAEALKNLVCEYSSSLFSPVILDCGSGEGYYTGKIKEALNESQVFGFDISKFAVKAAAGKYKNINFAVASVFDIPFKSESVDILVDVFSPLCEDEFLRVLKKGGYFIFAVPGERHLFEMKEILYDSPYENEKKDTEYKGFEFVSRVPVNGRIDIDNNEDIMALFSMTPYYWKTSVEGSNKLKETKNLSLEIEFDFLIYKKI